MHSYKFIQAIQKLNQASIQSYYIQDSIINATMPTRICINASRPALIPVCWSGKNYFALPIKSEKQNTAEAIGTGSFKIFQNSFESLGFIHISISCIKNQQLINQIDQTSLHSH